MSFTEALHGRSVLVTGAGGFIGGALCPKLVAQGAQVTGTGRSPEPADFPGRWIACDLADRSAVRRLIATSRPEFVFHLAGRTVGDQGVQAVWANLQDNLLSTVTLLLELVEYCCSRVVVSGSLREPDFDAEPTPTSPYAAAKLSASAYARMFYRLYGVPVVIARLFMVYGPGRQDMDKLVPYVANQLAYGQEARISSGSSSFDFVYIDDVVRGLIAVGTAPNIEGKTVDIGGGTQATVAEVAGAIAERIGKAHLLRSGAIPDRKFEPNRVADIEMTAALIGWRAEVSLGEGLERFLAWHAATHVRGSPGASQSCRTKLCGDPDPESSDQIQLGKDTK